MSRRTTLNRIHLKNSLAIANLNYQKEHEIAEIKSKFFTNISHEFRTPLTLMIGPLEDLSEEKNLDPPVKTTIKNIQNQAKRLLSLINQLLDFHKAEVSALKLNNSYCDIVALSKTYSLPLQKKPIEKTLTLPFYLIRRNCFC